MDRLIINRVEWGHHYADAWEGMQILRDFLEAVEEDLDTRGTPQGFRDEPGNSLWDIRQALQIVGSIIDKGEHQTDAGEPDRQAVRQLVAAVRLLLASTQDTAHTMAPAPAKDAYSSGWPCT